MAIRRRGKSWFVDVSVNGRRKTATCRSLAEAQHKEEELKTALDSTTGTAPGVQLDRPWTVGEAFETACRTIWRKGTSNDRACMKSTEKIVEYFGADKTLAAVSTLQHLDDLQAWLEVRPHGPKGGKSRARGLKPSAVNRNMVAWSMLLRCAVDRGGLRERPKFPKNLKVHNGRIRFLTREEEATHLDWYASKNLTHHGWVFAVLIDTGMRMGEFYNLTEQDLDMEQKLIHIWETKADLPRTVPMTSRVFDIFKTHGTDLEWRPERVNFGRRFKDARESLGLADDTEYVPHALRHTCASRLVQNGVDILYVQKWLGHKQIIMTQRYAHLAPDSLRHAVAALEVAA